MELDEYFQLPVETLFGGYAFFDDRSQEACDGVASHTGKYPSPGASSNVQPPTSKEAAGFEELRAMPLPEVQAKRMAASSSSKELEYPRPAADDNEQHVSEVRTTLSLASTPLDSLKQATEVAVAPHPVLSRPPSCNEKETFGSVKRILEPASLENDAPTPTDFQPTPSESTDQKLKAILKEEKFVLGDEDRSGESTPVHVDSAAEASDTPQILSPLAASTLQQEATPEAGDPTSPVSAVDCTSPVSAGDSTSPVSAGSSTSPVLAGDLASPVLAGDLTSPVLAGDSTSSVSIGDSNSTSIASTDNSQIPETADDSPIPESADDVSSPESADNTPSPGSGDDSPSTESADDLQNRALVGQSPSLEPSGMDRAFPSLPLTAELGYATPKGSSAFGKRPSMGASATSREHGMKKRIVTFATAPDTFDHSDFLVTKKKTKKELSLGLASPGTALSPRYEHERRLAGSTPGPRRRSSVPSAPHARRRSTSTTSESSSSNNRLKAQRRARSQGARDKFGDRGSSSSMEKVAALVFPPETGVAQNVAIPSVVQQSNRACSGRLDDHDDADLSHLDYSYTFGSVDLQRMLGFPDESLIQGVDTGTEHSAGDAVASSREGTAECAAQDQPAGNCDSSCAATPLVTETSPALQPMENVKGMRSSPARPASPLPTFVLRRPSGTEVPLHSPDAPSASTPAPKGFTEECAPSPITGTAVAPTKTFQSKPRQLVDRRPPQAPEATPPNSKEHMAAPAAGAASAASTPQSEACKPSEARPPQVPPEATPAATQEGVPPQAEGVAVTAATPQSKPQQPSEPWKQQAAKATPPINLAHTPHPAAETATAATTQSKPHELPEARPSQASAATPPATESHVKKTAAPSSDDGATTPDSPATSKKGRLAFSSSSGSSSPLPNLFGLFKTKPLHSSTPEEKNQPGAGHRRVHRLSSSARRTSKGHAAGGEAAASSSAPQITPTILATSAPDLSSGPQEKVIGVVPIIQASKPTKIAQATHKAMLHGDSAMPKRRRSSEASSGSKKSLLQSRMQLVDRRNIEERPRDPLSGSGSSVHHDASRSSGRQGASAEEDIFNRSLGTGHGSLLRRSLRRLRSVTAVFRSDDPPARLPRSLSSTQPDSAGATFPGRAHSNTLPNRKPLSSVQFAAATPSEDSDDRTQSFCRDSSSSSLLSGSQGSVVSSLVSASPTTTDMALIKQRFTTNVFSSTAVDLSDIPFQDETLCTEVLSGIYVGNVNAICQPSLLALRRIRYIVNLSGKDIPLLPLFLVTHDCFVPVSEEFVTPSLFSTAGDFISQHHSSGYGIIIYSEQGVSRAPACIVHYLVRHRRKPLCDALSAVRGRLPDLCLSRTLLKVLIEVERQEHGSVSMTVQDYLSIKGGDRRGQNASGSLTISQSFSPTYRGVFSTSSENLI